MEAPQWGLRFPLLGTTAAGGPAFPKAGVRGRHRHSPRKACFPEHHAPQVNERKVRRVWVCGINQPVHENGLVTGELWKSMCSWEQPALGAVREASGGRSRLAHSAPLAPQKHRILPAPPATLPQRAPSPKNCTKTSYVFESFVFISCLNNVTNHCFLLFVLEFSLRRFKGYKFHPLRLEAYSVCYLNELNFVDF